ncbi:hypothetical protein Pcinc_028455 [Petrolisthes cinctipes]|uniref:Uncharacterized protein n=1 Tax=Petrolisthes cinctipes TaxID=88211 RepID=A0AAE1F211_PETCI|nr:hypothetical protein Pcinc_028455 [Petrolisthes cinctipes]
MLPPDTLHTPAANTYNNNNDNNNKNNTHTADNNNKNNTHTADNNNNKNNTHTDNNKNNTHTADNNNKNNTHTDNNNKNNTHTADNDNKNNTHTADNNKNNTHTPDNNTDNNNNKNNRFFHRDNTKFFDNTFLGRDNIGNTFSGTGNTDGIYFADAISNDDTQTTQHLNNFIDNIANTLTPRDEVVKDTRPTPAPKQQQQQNKNNNNGILSDPSMLPILKAVAEYLVKNPQYYQHINQESVVPYDEDTIVPHDDLIHTDTHTIVPHEAMVPYDDLGWFSRLLEAVVDGVVLVGVAVLTVLSGGLVFTTVVPVMVWDSCVVCSFIAFANSQL